MEIKNKKNTEKNLTKDKMEEMDHMEHMKHMDHTEHMKDMKDMSHGHEGHNMVMDHSMHGGNHKMGNSMNMDHSMHMGNFKQTFFISLLIAIPIIFLSPMMGLNLPFQFTFKGSDWVVFILATIIFFYGGKPFLDGAKMEIKMKNPAMMTLISLGITVSYFYSAYGFIANKFFTSNVHYMNFFWELATLIVIMLLGHWIEMNAISSAGDALQKMAALLPETAHLISDKNKIVDVPLSEIKKDDKILIKAGENIPADGIVLSGTSTVNESLVTGEAKEVSKNIKDKVIGGTINGTGSITIQVTGTGETGYLSQVMKLVSDAGKDKSKIETLSDKVARSLFYVALISGIVAFIVWLVLTKNFNLALERMVTVFIIACPHALGLAIPLVVARSTSLGAKHGLLVQNRESLEIAKNIDVVLMDKTGTLTEGNFSVRIIKSLVKDIKEDQILTWLSALESNSTHPLAIGILKVAKEQKKSIPDAENVEVIPGVGLSGMIDGEKFHIVTGDYLDKNSISYDETSYEEALSKGYSISFLLRDKVVLGMVAQGDKIKENAKDTIDYLKSQKIKPVMATGDNKKAAEKVASQIGITDIYAGLLPDDKEKIVKSYQAKNKKVMMVGDGINDAPGLVRADIGVAIGAGTDVAIDSADVILVKSDPSDIIAFITLSKRTMRKMIQNIWWGAGYNIVAIPLAAGILAPIGITLSPAFGAILMSISTVIVALNSMSLNLKDFVKDK